MQVSKPGVLELVERPTPTPAPGEVLIDVQACGICGADINDIEKADAVQPPRVPGHEVVGRLAAMGPGVPSRWKVGQRVGIGRLGGHCNECDPCRQGVFQLCQNQHFVGATCDGGYAELMLARATGLVAIPDALNSEEAAPILCAGIATFNALKKSGAQAGDTVAVLGIGGLGHMAIQYARRMGLKVVALGRGGDKELDALALGAHVYVDTEKADAASELKVMGGAHAIVTTTPSASVASALLHGLASQGRLVVLGAGRDAISVAPGHLVVGERSVLGSLTGTPYESERTLDFSVLADVRPMYESLPLERAAEAYQRLRRGDVKFRLVLTMSAA